MSKRYAASAVVSIAALSLFFFQVPLGGMLDAFRRMHPAYLALSLAAYCLSYLFRALRWQVLLRSVGRTGFYDTLSALVIGFMGNNLLPAHLGEFIRAYVLKRQCGHTVSASMATIVLERVFDGLTALLFLVTALFFMPPHAVSETSLITVANLHQAAWAGSAVFGGMLVALQFFRWQRERSLAVLRLALSPLPEKASTLIFGMADEFSRGLSLVSLPSLLLVMLHSVLTWGMVCLYTWFLFPAFGLHLDFFAAMLIQVMLVLALLIPAAPGAIGTYHLAAASMLIFLGVDDSMAGTIAMTLWLIHYIVTNIAGLGFAWQTGLGFKALSIKSPQ